MQFPKTELIVLIGLAGPGGWIEPVIAANAPSDVQLNTNAQDVSVVQIARAAPETSSSVDQPSNPASEKKHDQLEEVVITASKRSTTVQDTPMSVTAISGEDILNRGITEFDTLAASTPGVSLHTSGPGQTEIEMRGLTSAGGNSATVGFYVDDTPLTAPAGAQTGKVVIDPSLYDLNRVEVLRGPQGTLYGASSMGGTVRLITNQPNLKAFDATAQTILSGSGDGGGFNHGENVMLNVPLVDGIVALRVVGSEAYTSGWLDRIVIAPGQFPIETGPILPATSLGSVRGNLLAAPVAADYKGVNDEELVGTRVSLLWMPIDRLSITPSYFWQRIAQGGPNTFDSVPGTPAHYEVYNIPEPYTDNFRLWSLNIQYKFDSFDLTSTTAKWNRDQNSTQDATENFQFAFGLPSFYPPTGAGIAPNTEVDFSKQLSQETRLASSGDTAFKWLIGFFYSNFRSDFDFFQTVPGLANFGLITNAFTDFFPTTLRQTAGFGEISYQITRQFKATAGLRRYAIHEEFQGAENGAFGPTGTSAFFYTSAGRADQGFDPKFDLSYEPNSELMLYTTAARGFRAGGGNFTVPTGSVGSGPACRASLASIGLTAAPESYAPDTVWSYELGEKAELLDHRIKINSDVYFENWNGVQQAVTLSCGYGFADNAGKAQVYGSEVELKAILVPGLVLSENLGYTHARITQGNPGANTVPGDPLQDVPTWTNNVSLSYTTDISEKLAFTARAENTHVSSSYDATFYQFNYVPGYYLTNIRAGVSTNSWSASLFANNVFDRRAWLGDASTLSANLPTFTRVTVSQPLTVGIDFSYNFSH
jgi:iron complex outermembrane recepter protein